MKVSKDFVIEEFVPEEIYQQFGNQSTWFIDPHIIKIAQFFRDRYNLPITINDWHSGGLRQHSGFRQPDAGIGATLSQHKQGRAIDMKWLNQGKLTIDMIRDDIKQHQSEFMAVGVTTVEEGTETWLHVDCRYTTMDEILFVPFWHRKR